MRPASCRICSCFTTEMGRRLCGCEFAPVVFDKVKFNGEEKDPTERETTRSDRRWSARMLHSVPAVYDHQQHYVPEVMTGQCGMGS
ncbi:uncharacterized protein LOC119770639 isoform X3 [Culex quinquefasciatus]|uniref:uncharacterized protein LOC119770639 isoform X3 n=1 Tax=Culex quinquefasciatus TaxID=7176 RepID=UPI0018E3623E|nr:uncharacterized protein LOC119770639 isoform X3 [Culex quinquefasciatus]